MLNETNIPAIQQGIKSIITLNENDSIRAMAWEREKAERDYYSEIGNARAAGKAEGRAEGRAEERSKIIEKLRSKGLSEEEIGNLID